MSEPTKPAPQPPLAVSTGSAEPLRISYSREEALNQARMWMVHTYGSPRELVPDERDRFHERLGMLVDFIDGMFPHEPTAAVLPSGKS